MLKIRKRGTLWPAQLWCGHLALVSSAQLDSRSAICRACRVGPTMISVRTIVQRLRLTDSKATRPSAYPCQGLRD